MLSVVFQLKPLYSAFKICQPRSGWELWQRRYCFNNGLLLLNLYWRLNLI